ncbi:MAG: response regulator [Alcanivoracaceae bacterium]|nr:response regulator [Alcanivoracaceae bacterium]
MQPIHLFATEIKFEKIQSLDVTISDTIWALAKDQQGYLWIGSNSGLFIYDGYKINSASDLYPATNVNNVRKIFNDSTGTLWIGTKGNGIYRLINHRVKPFISSNNIDAPKHITEIIEGSAGLWVGTYNNLVFISKENRVQKFPLPSLQSSDNKVMITGIVEISEQKLLITTQYEVYTFNKTTQTFTKQEIEGLKSTYINALYKDNDANIWLGTDLGVFLRTNNNTVFLPYSKQSISYRIDAFAIDDDNIWLGSTKKGLVRVSKQDASITEYKYNSVDSSSISGNAIRSMIIDDSGVMFLSFFHGGLSYFNTHSVKFGLQNRSASSIACADSPIFHGIDVDTNSLWISSVSGLIEFNTIKKKCVKHNFDTNNQNVFNPYHPLFSFKDSSNNRWITSNKAFYKIDQNTGLIDSSFQAQLNAIIYHMIEVSPNEFLLGSNNGLYQFSSSRLKKIEAIQQNLNNADIYKIIKITSNEFLLATDNGLAVLNSEGIYKIYSKIQAQLPTKKVNSIYHDGQHLWLGTLKHGLFKFNENGDLITRYDNKNGMSPKLSIFSIIDDDKYLWMGTDNGLVQLNTKTDQAHVFHKSDGLQGDFFILGSATKSDSGKLYFGGRNGLNAFYPEDIKIDTIAPNIVLTNLTRFGKVVQTGVKQDGFIINKPINNLQELTLTHKDYVIGFEFAALDLADPKRNKYAYKMDGLDPDWNYVNADDRKISYSNLKAGDYVFRVKGTNKDGVWNDTGKSLKIKVLPAPWLSWWAYTLYILSLISLLLWYLNWKNKANAKITKMLRSEVKKQTRELNIQKQTVESLLEKKNEMFANVSHEFRTPLTLILGPINKLLKSHLSLDSRQSLQMVNRNANRLLTMIEQLLLLAKMTDDKNLSFIPQQVHTSIETIVASFQSLAETKNITLTLLQNDEAAISATQDSIDIILGNLLSNAIKYTQIGGSVTVSSYKHEQYINFEVTDTGCGLDKQQQSDIFNRFKRLDAHHNIAGIGIGLSVVEEVIKVNNGTIKVSSSLGKGSIFSVQFHCIDFNKSLKTTPPNQILINQIIKEANIGDISSTSQVQFIGNKNNESILIIDDNDDMRTHIAETLKHQYYCLLTPRGKSGIALAIKHVPDIIVCDVMMPEMDGFQVSRIMRSDNRTSHIPLILLTALNDKKSRIKGWRENIDVYLTKPFDADELLIQLENILVIRNILKKKAGAAIKAGKGTMNSGLPKNDQIFIDKFMNMIANMYTNPHFHRPQMASMMAVSDRQLQRKMKALIDKNPLDLLRDYRLKKATEILKDGYQVSITADKCGFNSVTYFSKCFRQQYGMSPKIYQQTCDSRSKNNK